MASYKLKAFAERVLPASLYLSILQGFRKYAPSSRRKFEIELGQRLESNGKIIDGPFKGMNYLALSHGSAYLPKLLGCYELEVTDFVNSCCQVPLDTIIDIGTAEGYYAVGFAFRVPTAKVFAYDTSKVAQILTKRLATQNGVEDRVEARGTCDYAALTELLSGSKSSLVICDCEGCEEFLMDPAKAPGLEKARLLVETHSPEIMTTLMERLSVTHQIQKVGIQPRPLPPSLAARVSVEEWVRASDESRIIDQDWLLCVPKQSS